MNKIKCSNCGTLNFEKVTICFNCRKAVSQTNNIIGQNTKRKVQNPNKTTTFDLKKVSKIVLNTVLLIGIGIGGYFGYQQYSKWTEAQRQIEIAKKEAQEMENFKSISFKDKPSDFATVINQIPKKFQISPPDLVFVNNFPLKEKVVTYYARSFTGETYYQPTEIPMAIVNGVQTGGGRIGNGVRRNYSTDRLFQMLKINRITDYLYSKNAFHQLEIEVKFVAEYLSVERKTSTYNCPNKTMLHCNEARKIEGKGSMKMTRVNDAWEINEVKGSSPYSEMLVSWNKEKEVSITEDIQRKFIPDWESNTVSIMKDEIR